MDIEHGFAKGAHELVRIDRSNAADDSGAEIFSVPSTVVGAVALSGPWRAFSADLIPTRMQQPARTSRTDISSSVLIRVRSAGILLALRE